MNDRFARTLKGFKRAVDLFWTRLRQDLDGTSSGSDCVRSTHAQIEISWEAAGKRPHLLKTCADERFELRRLRAASWARERLLPHADRRCTDRGLSMTRLGPCDLRFERE